MIILDDKLEYQKIYTEEKIMNAAIKIEHKLSIGEEFSLYVNKFGEFDFEFIYNRSKYIIEFNLDEDYNDLSYEEKISKIYNIILGKSVSNS